MGLRVEANSGGDRKAIPLGEPGCPGPNAVSIAGHEQRGLARDGDVQRLFLTEHLLHRPIERRRRDTASEIRERRAAGCLGGGHVSYVWFEGCSEF